VKKDNDPPGRTGEKVKGLFVTGGDWRQGGEKKQGGGPSPGMNVLRLKRELASTYREK